MKTAIYLLAVILGIIVAIPLTIWKIANEQANENIGKIRKHLEAENITKK